MTGLDLPAGGSPPQPVVLRGQCLCGALRYTVPDEFRYALNCHCSDCRRATGSAFKPFAGVARDKFHLEPIRWGLADPVQPFPSIVDVLWGDSFDNATGSAGSDGESPEGATRTVIGETAAHLQGPVRSPREREAPSPPVIRPTTTGKRSTDDMKTRGKH